MASSSINHDVFLSFRGEDTRNTFTAHLYTALKQTGIRTFFDDTELQRGNDISSELLTAIEQSRISIIVFSKNYASSGWCLNELVKILECKRTTGQLVLPIFYDVDPSDVRRQTGSFANAFANYKDTEKVEIWRAALNKVSNFSGYHLQNDPIAKGNEAKLIMKIVDDVMHVVQNYTSLEVATHPVGMDSRIEDVKFLLSSISESVCTIGIYGMGGVGKTTIAKTVYNTMIQHYECSCFLENVREVSKQPNGLAHLQEKLLSSILKKDIKVDSVHKGINLMKERLGFKKVLIVLDDLDELIQVGSLVGEWNLFGSGSRIIITTRNEHVLNTNQVKKKYEAKILNPMESLELFSWHAFKTNTPPKDFLGLSSDIVTYCGCLPLALEVVGSYLYGRTPEEWKDAFENLKVNPNAHIQEKLSISFKGLDANEKKIFLDIASFFIGMDQHHAINIFDACGLFPKIAFTTLREKCLLTINKRNELRMHDLLRDMGRQIVREESNGELGKCSRLWDEEDIIDVLKNHKGTKNIEGIILEKRTEELELSTQTFEMMHKLRLLEINNVHLTGSFEHIFEGLKWLRWKNCPLECLPSSFHPENLVVLELKKSKLNILWEATMLIENLKILDLSRSKYLTTTPDFTGIQRLESLILFRCKSLKEVHQSIRLLSRLVELDLEGCRSLTSLPISIFNLRSLQILNLRGCKDLYDTNLDLVPLCSPISFLPSSISSLCCLEYLDLSLCRLTDRDISNDIGSLSSLKVLYLSYNYFLRSLPSSLGQLFNLTNLFLTGCTSLQSLPKLPPNLKTIDLESCTCLESLPELPPNLEELFASECTSLEKIPNLKCLQRLGRLYLCDCWSLGEIQGWDNLSSLSLLDLRDCRNLETTTLIRSLIKRSSEFHPGFQLLLPVMEIPDWCHHRRPRCLISFDMPLLMNVNVPTNTSSNFLGFIVFDVQLRGHHHTSVVISNKTNDTTWSRELPFRGKEYSMVIYIPKEDPIQCGDRIEISFRPVVEHYSLPVNRIGAHLVYESSHDMMEIDDKDHNMWRNRDHVNVAEEASCSSSKRLKV